MSETQTFSMRNRLQFQALLNTQHYFAGRCLKNAQITGKNSQRVWLSVYLTFLHAAINYIYYVEKVNVSFVKNGPEALHNIFALRGMQRAGISSSDAQET